MATWQTRFLFILLSGVEQIGETKLAQMCGFCLETAHHQLRMLAALGYMVRSSRYDGYELTSLVYDELFPWFPKPLNPAHAANALHEQGTAAPVSPIYEPPIIPGFCPPQVSLEELFAEELGAETRRNKPARTNERDRSALAHPPQAPATGTPPPPSTPAPDHSLSPAASVAALERGISALHTPQRGNPAVIPGDVNDDAGDTQLNLINRIPPPSPQPSPDLSGDQAKAAQTMICAQPLPDEPQADDEECEYAAGEDEEYAPRSQEEIEAARRILRACGIGEPTRSQLLELEWVTDEYILEWRRSLDDHPGSGKWGIGLLILRLRSQEWPPASSRDRYRSYY